MTDQISTEGLELMAKLMEASMTETQGIIDLQLESLRRQLAEAQATVELIRNGVYGLLGGDFMPSSWAIERALWPAEHLIQAAVAETGDGS